MMQIFRGVAVTALLLTIMLTTGPVHGEGVTVIIHGWHVSTAEPWFPAAMQAAIADTRLGADQHLGTITVTGTLGNLTATCDPWNVDLASSSNGEIIIDVDWHAVSDHLLSGVAAQEVAAVIAPKLYQGQNGELPVAELPIHLIGHSRGGGMVCEIARLLGEQGIEVDHLTPLDPHPLTNTGVDPQPLVPVIDTPVAVYENVLFADSYWQDITYPEGEYVAGAYNRLWTSIPGGYHNHINIAYSNVADHLNIHLMYHGTVDLTTPTGDEEAILDSSERNSWFSEYETVQGLRGAGTGFFYSRIDGGGDRLSTDTPVAGGDRVVDGVHDDPVLGGGGARADLGWASAVWPNVITLQVEKDGSALPAGLSTVEPGTVLDLVYSGRDLDSSCNVTLLLDADRNPHNSNTVLTITNSSHGAGEAIFSATESWDTTAVSPGTEGYVMAMVDDGTRTRYLYGDARIRVEEASIFADGFESGNTGAWTATAP